MDGGRLAVDGGPGTVNCSSQRLLVPTANSTCLGETRAAARVITEAKESKNETKTDIRATAVKAAWLGSTVVKSLDTV